MIQLQAEDQAEKQKYDRKMQEKLVVTDRERTALTQLIKAAEIMKMKEESSKGLERIEEENEGLEQ